MTIKKNSYFLRFNCPKCKRESRFFYTNESDIPQPLLCYLCRKKLHAPKFRMKRGAKKKISEELFRKLYYEENKTLAEIGRMFSVSKVAVSKIADTLGIKRRTPIQARDLSIELGRPSLKYKKINSNFFSNWNPQMAYVLGFIYADGCMFVKKHSWGDLWGVSIGQKDKEHLDKIKMLLQAEQPIIKSNKGLHLISICHKQIGADLRKFGLTPNKSLTINFPEVPDDCIRHFIRGVFDGDGSISTGRFRIGTGSKYFAEKLKQKLIEMLKIQPDKVQLYEENYTYRKNPFFVVNIRAKTVLGKLYHILYDGVNNEEYLIAKQIRFQHAISLVGDKDDKPA